MLYYDTLSYTYNSRDIPKFTTCEIKRNSQSTDTAVSGCFAVQKQIENQILTLLWSPYRRWQNDTSSINVISLRRKLTKSEMFGNVRKGNVRKCSEMSVSSKLRIDTIQTNPAKVLVVVPTQTTCTPRRIWEGNGNVNLSNNLGSGAARAYNPSVSQVDNESNAPLRIQTWEVIRTVELLNRPL